jgi:hypothetical protein
MLNEQFLFPGSPSEITLSAKMKEAIRQEFSKYIETPEADRPEKFNCTTFGLHTLHRAYEVLYLQSFDYFSLLCPFAALVAIKSKNDVTGSVQAGASRHLGPL